MPGAISKSLLSRTVVIVPAYNESKVIKQTLQSLQDHFDHIVCVNDGSQDDTAECVRETAAALLNHPINLGQGAALQTGIDYALLNKDYQFFITFDADGQHDPKDAQKMVAYLYRHKLDTVLGSRFLSEKNTIPKSRQLLLKAATVFTSLTTGLRLTDAHNGLRVFGRSAAERLRLTMPDMSHASQINQRIKELQLSYAEFPVTIIYNDYSKTKGQPAFNAVNIAFDTLLHKAIKKW